jgi:hypothetical protein
MSLPRTCPCCGDHPAVWRYTIHSGYICSYQCVVCGYAAELFQDVEQGRIKYVPEVKDA